MWRTGRTPPWAPALTGALLLLLATPLWSQQDGGMDFDRVTGGAPPPALHKYQARDGTPLHYREYAGSGDAARVIVLLHGSGYHSGYLQPLASGLAESDDVRVYTPDLRGHGPDPVRRGDVDYIGQLEDDLDDFLGLVRRAHPEAALLLAGHSSGGGLAIRHAGGDPQVPVDGYILLAPYIHHSAPTSAESNSDWADPKVLRLILLGLLNGVGITGLNDLTVIEFKMPEARPWPTATVCRRRCTRATTTAPTSPRSARPPWCWPAAPTAASTATPTRPCSASTPTTPK